MGKASCCFSAGYVIIFPTIHPDCTSLILPNIAARICLVMILVITVYIALLTVMGLQFLGFAGSCLLYSTTILDGSLLLSLSGIAVVCVVIVVLELPPSFLSNPRTMVPWCPMWHAVSVCLQLPHLGEMLPLHTHYTRTARYF